MAYRNQPPHYKEDMKMGFDPTALIGPHYTSEIIDLESASLEDRIALFEDRVRGYFTTPARMMIRTYENSVFLVLLIVSMCVEWIEIFHQGQSSSGRSKRFFKSGFQRIFDPSRPNDMTKDQFDDDLDGILDEVYYQVRSGLVHTGTTRSKVVITAQMSEPVRVDHNKSTGAVEGMQINPYTSLLAVEFFLSEYCTKLRDPENDDLRLKFDQAWQDLVCEE